jgi:hypothetical protein
LEVFDAWKQGKLIGEDWKRPANILKPPRLDITMNDVDRTIGLRDSELLLLAEEILKNEVSVKSNKIAGQRETITLNDWCMMRKYNRVIKNELMFEFRGKPLPSKKTGFQKYTDEEWEELALEKNFTDAVISNIRGEVMTLKDGSDWVSGRLNNLNPTNSKNAPAPNVYVLAVQKFAKCIVGMGTGMGAVKYEVRVSRSLQETIESLRVPSSFYRSLTKKAEIFFVFGFDGSGQSVLIKKLEFKLLSERISKNVEPDSEDSNSDDDNGTELVCPSYFLLEMSTSMTLYSEVASRNTYWSASTTHYLPSDGKPFKKAAIASKPLVNVSVLYNSVKDVREEWRSFSQFTGIRKEMHPVWDESREGRTQDWSGGKCSAPYGLNESLLQPALKKYKCVVINVKGGGNVTAVALVRSPSSLFLIPYSL